MAGIIMRQAMMMLLLNVVGMVAYYTKIINAEGGRQLSKLVLQIVNPVLVVMAYIEVECSAKMIRNLFWTFGLAIVLYILSIALVTLLIQEKEGRETAIERFSAIYSNCGFMGIPLANALLGLEGVFYVTAFLTIFNLFAWTHGIMLLTEKRDMRSFLKVLRSPTMIGIGIGLILFFTRVPIPGILADTMQYVANLNTPLAMIASGISVAQANVLQALRNGRIYYVCLIKLLLIPAVLTGVFLLLPFAPQNVRLILLVLTAAPSAAMCTLQCQQHKKNDVYASQIFAMTTILSMATMPVIVKLFTSLL